MQESIILEEHALDRLRDRSFQYPSEPFLLVWCLGCFECPEVQLVSLLPALSIRLCALFAFGKRPLVFVSDT